jgi:hypothetical protein
LRELAGPRHGLEPIKAAKLSAAATRL